DEASDTTSHQELPGKLEQSSCKKGIIHVCTIILSLSLFGLTFSPIQLLFQQGIRLVAVVLTVAIIVTGRLEDRQSIFLSNRVIVHLGDISYEVYLVHWPVIIMWKSYFDLPVLPFTDCLMCLMITFLISMCIHLTLEQMFIS
ncbi:hypothetical protein PMAYCL1PPCAC_32985, partial [Pristionchus mayeri]